MNTPPPTPSGSAQPSRQARADDAQLLAWLKLKHEVAELHARLEYVKLLLSLGVRPSSRPASPDSLQG